MPLKLLVTSDLTLGAASEGSIEALGDSMASQNLSSHDLWAFGLRQEVESLGINYLQGSTLELDGHVITGSIGWYDYSTALPEMNQIQESWIQTKLDNNVPDALRIDWEWSDPEFAMLVSRSLSRRLLIVGLRVS